MADVPLARSIEKTRARVDSLRVHPRNPRKISPARMEQLQRTLEAEPEMLEARPLICLPDGTVVAGNQRLLAARALGWVEVPVVYADLSEDEVTRWMLLDNRGFGEDDREAAATLLAELEERGGDLTLTGYDPDELDGLLRELRRSSITNAHAVSDHAAPLMLWHSTSQLRAVLQGLDAAQWVDRSHIVWDKGSIQGGIGQASKQYRTQFEPLIHAHKKGRTPRWFGPGNEADVWAIAGPRANPLHPTMKPAALYERTIANHSERADAVLEMFGGSGTSLIAAEMTGRRAFLMELSPAYCDVIRQRYADYTGRPELAP